VQRERERENSNKILAYFGRRKKKVLKNKGYHIDFYRSKVGVILLGVGKLTVTD
jgi:hypothetical protein